MSRRRKSEADVSLFPFLSVLCSLIGVFMLLLILVIGSRTLDGEARAVASEGYAVDSLIPTEEHAVYRQQIEALERDLSRRRTQRNELLGRVEELEVLLTAKTAELQGKGKSQQLIQGLELGKPEDVEMTTVAGGSATKRPRFVEVDEHGFLVHPTGERFTVAEVDDPNSPVAEFLLSIEKVRNDEYLLFLVRPEGIDAFNRIQKHLYRAFREKKLQRIDMGWEPFSQGWVLLSRKTAS